MGTNEKQGRRTCIRFVQKFGYKSDNVRDAETESCFCKHVQMPDADCYDSKEQLTTRRVGVEQRRAMYMYSMAFDEDG